MVDEANIEQQYSKDDIVDPLALKLGIVQNYRCTYRSGKGTWESRPVKNTDKWASDFFKVLHASTDEEVEISTGHKIQGLGFPGANAFTFTHDAGADARRLAIEMVNKGEIRAPRKNWDQNFGSQGGRPIEELKHEFSDMYAPTSRKANKMSEGIAPPLISEEEMEQLHDAEEVHEHEHTYADKPE